MRSEHRGQETDPQAGQREKMHPFKPCPLPAIPPPPPGSPPESWAEVMGLWVVLTSLRMGCGGGSCLPQATRGTSVCRRAWGCFRAGCRGGAAR